MRSRLSLLGGHPVHVMIVPFAMGPFALLLLFDALALVGAEPTAFASLATAGFGFAATGAAILTGLVDLAAIPDESPAHRIAAIHFVGGLVVLGLYAAVVWMTYAAGYLPGDPLLLVVDLAGTTAVGFQGWLGGELVTRYRLGVLEDEEGAEPVDLS